MPCSPTLLISNQPLAMPWEGTVRFEGPDCQIRRVVLEPKQLVILFLFHLRHLEFVVPAIWFLARFDFFFVVVEVEVVATWWNCEARRGEARGDEAKPLASSGCMPLQMERC